MKDMKLIFENFRKNMKEGWGGDVDSRPPWSAEPHPKMKDWIEQSRLSRNATKNAETEAVNAIMRQYTEQELHNMVYDELEDLFVNRYSDNHPKELLPDEDQIANMMKRCGILKPEEDYDMEKSDMEDPPGYMPGEGGNY